MSNCSLCNRVNIRGFDMNMFAPKEFYDFMSKLITKVSIRNAIPVGVSILIRDFVFNFPNLYIILEWIAFRGYSRWDPFRFDGVFTRIICVSCYEKKDTHRSKSKGKRPFNILV